MKKILIIVLIIGLIGGYFFINNNKPLEKASEESKARKVVEESSDLFGRYYEQANSILSKMSLEEKIGQLFIVQYDINYAPKWVKNYNVGGFILFAKDFDGHTKKTIKDEIDNLQNISSNGLIIAVDEEGGFVTRISRYKAFRESKFLAPKDYYAEGGYEKLEEIETEKANLLLSIGVNLNLAPVADVSTSEEDFINNRAFGKEANETADYIKHMVSYANKAGISSSLKHFPGYGNNVDTHTGIAIDNRDYESISTNDYLPFIAGIEEKVPTILVSHNVINCIDDKYPATLSEKVIKELREKLGFSGIIITDDLSMGAVKDYVKNGNAATLAIKAGNDLIITSSFEEMYNEVLEAVNNKELDEKIIDQAVKRIIAYKLAYKM